MTGRSSLGRSSRGAGTTYGSDTGTLGPIGLEEVRTPFTTTQRATLAVVCVATAMLMLDIAVVNTALPAIAGEFHAQMTALTWVVDGYTLALASLVLSAGAAADRIGRRAAFLAGAALFTVASLLSALAPGIGALDLARVAQGVGAALLFASSLALLAGAFTAAGQRSRALAAYGATIGASFAIGPLLGGVLTEVFGWRAIFVVNVPVGVVMIIAATRIPESRSATTRHGDLWGQAAAIVGLTALTYGFFEAGDKGWSAGSALVAFGVAAVAGIAFCVIEELVDQPMLPPAMLARLPFAGAQAATFAISASLFAVFVYVTIHLQGVLGLSPIAAGLVYLPGTVAMVIAAAVTDRIVSRVPAWVLLSIALAAVAAGLALMAMATGGRGAVALTPGFLVACVGAGVFNPVVSGVVLAESHSDDVGLASGINDVFRQSGIALGVAALGAVLPAHSVLTGGSRADYVDGVRTAEWIACAIALIGALAVVVTMRRARAVPDDAGTDMVHADVN